MCETCVCFLCVTFHLRPLRYCASPPPVPPTLCKCLEVVKSLLVFVISHWFNELSSSVRKSHLFNFTCRLMEIIRKAQWVPPPLAYAGEIFAFIGPKDITGIMMNVWDFIRDYPPSPSSYRPCPLETTTTDAVPMKVEERVEPHHRAMELELHEQQQQGQKGKEKVNEVMRERNGLISEGDSGQQRQQRATTTTTNTPSRWEREYDKAVQYSVEPYAALLKSILHNNITELSAFYWRFFQPHLK